MRTPVVSHAPPNGPFRWAVLQRGGVPENSPLALMGRRPLLNGPVCNVNVREEKVS